MSCWINGKCQEKVVMLRSGYRPDALESMGVVVSTREHVHRRTHLSADEYTVIDDLSIKTMIGSYG